MVDSMVQTIGEQRGKTDDAATLCCAAYESGSALVFEDVCQWFSKASPIADMCVWNIRFKVCLEPFDQIVDSLFTSR